VIRAYQQLHTEQALQPLCTALEVSRSWYYARPTDPVPDEEETALVDAIERIVLEHSGYGYRRVTQQLQREGWTINHKRVLRLMREESLLCRLKKRFVRTTDSNHAFEYYPNLLKGRQLTRPNEAWAADLTYIHLPTCFCYLAVILDVYSRYCVGWHLSRDIDTPLTLAALERAISQRGPLAGLIHHSDRGVQSASRASIDRLKQIGAQPSMSAKGNPYDNAFAESFFKTLKREEVYLKEYRSFQEANTNLGPFIEAVYNQKRLHSGIGYLPPQEFEDAYWRNLAMQPN
jgi:transposase InsO family protein